MRKRQFHKGEGCFMDEIEFAQIVAETLDEKSRECVLQSMQSHGFSIDGFRNLRNAPIKILQASLKKPIKKSNVSTADIFLKEVRQCTLDDPIVKIVRLWNGTEEQRNQAEEEITHYKKKIKKPQEQNKTNNKDVETKKLSDENEIEEANKLRDKNKLLRQKIQNLKIQIDDLKNQLLIEKKYNTKLDNNNVELAEENKTIKEKNIEYETQIDFLKKHTEELTDKIKFYEHVLENSPRTLCFTKSEVSKENIYLYNMDIHGDLSDIENIDWKQYKRIWVSESDFPFDKIQQIMELSGRNVKRARNINNIIERIINEGER
jgi:chromosome segregation ATPase